jgi:small subunit ribosomal protein S16
MAVKLRLRRTGAKNQPNYRIVAADARFPRDGRFIEVIGYYNPTRQPAEFRINEELALKWLHNGAQPTETVGDLLVQLGIMSKFYERQGKPVPAEALPRPAEAAPEAAQAPAAQPEAAVQPEAAQAPAEESAAPEAEQPAEESAEEADRQQA